MHIAVLRLGHRLPRDERISTHVALVARAFGAGEIIYSGQHDTSLESSVSSIVKNWGGEFSIRYAKNFLGIIKNLKKEGFCIAHLTMFGIPISEKIEEVKENARSREKILIIVGAERVPKEVYELADFNIAITSQPHSEVAALAIFLDRLLEGKELERNYDDRFEGKMKIEPMDRGKKVKKQT